MKLKQPNQFEPTGLNRGVHGEWLGGVADGLPFPAALNGPCDVGVGADPPGHSGAAHGEQHRAAVGWLRGLEETAHDFGAPVDDPAGRRQLPGGDVAFLHVQHCGQGGVVEDAVVGQQLGVGELAAQERFELGDLVGLIT